MVTSERRTTGWKHDTAQMDGWIGPRHLTHACHSHTTGRAGVRVWVSGYRRAAIVPGSLLLNALGLALCKAYINGDIQTRN